MNFQDFVAHVSPSQLGTFLRCGEQYRRRYVEKEIIPPGISARTGSSVHKVAEVHDLIRIQGKTGLSITDAQDCARDEFKRLVKDEGVFLAPAEVPEANKLLNEGLNSALAAAAFFVTDVAPNFDPLAAEQVMLYDIDVLDVPIKCIIDKLASSVLDGRTFIRDLKVMGKKKDQAWADDELQPSFYLLGHLLQHNELLQFAYDIIIPGKKGIQYLPLETTRDERDFQRTKILLSQFRKAVEADIFMPADPGSWMCSPNYCGFYQSCRYACGWKMIAAQEMAAQAA